MAIHDVAGAEQRPGTERFRSETIRIPVPPEEGFAEIAMPTGVVVEGPVFLVVAGLVWVQQTSGTYTPALGLPLNWIFYAALPLTAGLGCYFAVKRLMTGQYAEMDVGQEVGQEEELAQ